MSWAGLATGAGSWVRGSRGLGWAGLNSGARLGGAGSWVHAFVGRSQVCVGELEWSVCRAGNCECASSRGTCARRSARVASRRSDSLTGQTQSL